MNEMVQTVRYIEQRMATIQAYSKKLAGALTSLSAHLRGKVDKEYVDSEPFRLTDDYKYYLYLGPEGLLVKRIDSFERVDYFIASELRRDTLKDLYRSGRLPVFLKSVASELEKEEHEYSELIRIAEAIENIVNAIKS